MSMLVVLEADVSVVRAWLIVQEFSLLVDWLV